ncbi:hypothetical protein EZV61_11410 [Corallincola luteus]|uniref:Uncharacterized protein n=2 Tax=Corallincola TaxID=1775176 RepID=A0A368N6Q4_9GAMM|nr:MULTISPECIES: hypothetical protein [Corallincola]RCU45251.1 hypothetical protein DU002_16150 [Corallincola holothuriorum]TCI02895.1 hypothetical protein EZV61_11410 [Corallincola luteus]
MNDAPLTSTCPFCTSKLAERAMTCPSCDAPLEKTPKADAKWLTHKGIEYVWYTQQAELYATERALDPKRLIVEIQSGARQGYCENGTWFVRYELATKRRGRNIPMIAASVATIATLLVGGVYTKGYTATAHNSERDRAMLLCKADVEGHAEPGEITYIDAQTSQPSDRLWQVTYQLEFNTRTERGVKKVATCVLTDGQLSNVELVTLK